MSFVLSSIESKIKSLFNSQHYIVDNTWVSGSSVKNYIVNDPLIDWLEFYAKDLGKKANQSDEQILATLSRIAGSQTSVDLLNPFLPEISNVAEAIEDDDPNDSTYGSRQRDPKMRCLSSDIDRNFLMAQGNRFEKALIETIEKVTRLKVINIGGAGYNSNDPAKFKQTIEAMKRGDEIIYSGILHDPVTKTKGIPDLIVRSDKLHLLVDKAPLPREVQKIKAPLCPGDFHYVIIDIKWTTLQFTSDMLHLCNTGFVKAYKAQVYIYNRILASVQGYDPQVAFLLGRRWSCDSQDSEQENALDRLGHVSFAGHDKNIPAMADAAINWLRDVRANGAHWNLLSSPLPRKELYPNMSNILDEPWRPVKLVIARAIGDITLLWRCGLKEREKAHSAGVYSLKDPRFNLDLLGIKNQQKRETLERMLAAHDRQSDPKRLILSINSALKTPAPLELFVDFEGVTKTMQDFTKLPACVSITMIFWIGVIYPDPVSQTWKYQRFVADYLTVDEEEKICRAFGEFVHNLKVTYKTSTARLFHWSHAEKSTWNAAYERISMANRTMKNGRSLRKRDRAAFEDEFSIINREWVDLCKIFKDEHIVVPGCSGFGLKEVAKAFYSRGLIRTTWDDENLSPSGLLGSIASALMNRSGSGLMTTTSFEKISRYNEADCRVMQEIVTALRSA